MLSKKISQFFLAIFFVTSLACTANATTIDYSNSFSLSDGSDATILFTIDTDQGTDSYPSMHNGLDAIVTGYNAYDSLFTISLTVDGTPYSDDAFSWTEGYPLVTLNSDGSVNAIEYWVTTGTNGTLYVIESTSGTPTLTAISNTNNYSGLDSNGDGVIDEDGYNDLGSDGITNLIVANADTSVTIAGTWATSAEWPVSEIPEPATFTLFGLGLFGLAWFSRRRSLK
ncbi:PEP-CTERM sorting domain-containing protein [Desulfobacter curvatus]|uniref:PEP-CTERM sorting domain-containing protein n=1 Tax=Desulfobacter curvatus TaxID=2290 RepID=UPI000362C52C|nr:PEP-CTERM sorting domain-containing protein [Desulfobacter curvatus]